MDEENPSPESWGKVEEEFKKKLLLLHEFIILNWGRTLTSQEIFGLIGALGTEQMNFIEAFSAQDSEGVTQSCLWLIDHHIYKLRELKQKIRGTIGISG